MDSDDDATASTVADKLFKKIRDNRNQLAEIALARQSNDRAMKAKQEEVDAFNHQYQQATDQMNRVEAGLERSNADLMQLCEDLELEIPTDLTTQLPPPPANRAERRRRQHQ